MSRIGNTPVTIPEGVTVNLDGHTLTVKGPKGELTDTLPRNIKINIENSSITFTRPNNTPDNKALHGLVRSLVANMVEGVTEGFSRTLEMVGTGYRVSKQGNGLQVTVGLSHPVDIEAVEGVTLEAEGNNIIHVKGINKQVVGQVAANIRKIRPPEPYKGKGIRYQGEHVRRKAGKAAKAAA